MAKSKRVKSAEPIIPIYCWEDADTMVSDIAAARLAIQKAEQRASDSIKIIKSRLADTVKPFQEEIKVDCLSLDAFAVEHESDFGNKRSRKLNFGTIGWRKSTSISVKKTTLEKIKEVFSPAKAKSLLHIKETPNKEALAKLTDEQLVRVAARRKVTDDFFVEPDLTKAADYK